MGGGAIFQDTISGFHTTSKNTTILSNEIQFACLTWQELSAGVLYWQLPVLPLVKKKYFSVFIEQSTCKYE